MDLRIILEAGLRIDDDQVLRALKPGRAPFNFDSTIFNSVHYPLSWRNYDKALKEVAQGAFYPFLAAVIVNDMDEPATFGWCYPDDRYPDGHERPLILLDWKNLNKWTPQWFTSTFMGWVLRHELGHAFGLKHQLNPLCVMAKPNVSFGRFCRSCMRKAKMP